MGKGKDKKGKELDLTGASRGVWLIKASSVLFVYTFLTYALSPQTEYKWR